jgi:hypothetical protein
MKDIDSKLIDRKIPGGVLILCGLILILAVLVTSSLEVGSLLIVMHLHDSYRLWFFL